VAQQLYHGGQQSRQYRKASIKVKKENITLAPARVVDHTYGNSAEAVAEMLEWFAKFSVHLANLNAVSVARYDLCGPMAQGQVAGGVLVVWVGGRQAAVATFVRAEQSRTILTITETFADLLDCHDEVP
jgi:hypothetical protein